MAMQDTEMLFERQEAVSAIDETIASALRHEGSVAVIEAAGGLGKTTLLARARERASSAGFVVASARGAELERDFAFGVVRQLFDRIVIRASTADREELFAGSARMAAPVLGLDTLSSPTAEGSAAMHGLYWLVADLAERGPLLFCVDDAQLSDTMSLRWLQYLVRRLEDLPVAVLIAARPQEPGTDRQTLEAIAADAGARAVVLAPLTPSATADLVRREFGSSAADDFCAECHSLSGGNPFLLRELIDELARNGFEPTPESLPSLREFVPETVTRSVARRMARLPADAGGLAHAVAVLGSGAFQRDAGALAELDADRTARAAGDLASVGILTAGSPLRFGHPLIEAAVLSDLAVAERAVAHARAARVVASGGAPADRVAAHLLRAQPMRDPWVVEELRGAAAEAMTRADARSAIALLRRAFVEPVSAEARIPVLQELLQAEFTALDPTALEGLDADPVAEITSDPAALQESALVVMLSLFTRGRPEEALEVLERAVSTAVAAGDDDLALRLEVRWITFAQVGATKALQRLEPYASRVDPDTFAGRLLDASSAWFGTLTGRSAAQTRERATRAFSDGSLVTDLQRDEWVLGSCVMGLLLTDDFDLAERLIEQTLELARARGSVSAVASGSFLSAYLARQRGDLVRAEGDAQTAVRAFGEAGFLDNLPFMTALLVDTLVEMGRLSDATTELRIAGMDDEVPLPWSFAPVLSSRAKLRIAEGRTQDGVDDLRELGRRAGRRHRGGALLAHPWAASAAPGLFELGDRDGARKIAERELRDAREWGTPRVIGQTLRVLGLITTGASGTDLMRQAVDVLATSPARLEQGRAMIDLGAMLRRSNHRAEARDPLQAGLDIAQRCGARPLADRALYELRAAGAKPRKSMVTGIDALTASERRIAEMAAEGLTNRQIAQALFVTVRTVETHLGHAFQKLGIRSRTELPPVRP